VNIEADTRLADHDVYDEYRSDRPTLPAVEARTGGRRSLGEDAQGEGGIREVPKAQPAAAAQRDDVRELRFPFGSGGESPESLAAPGGQVVTLRDELPWLHLDDLDRLPELG
jgi:hypothetical protein